MRAGRFEGGSFAFGLDLTPIVRRILAVTFGVWVLELLLGLLGSTERLATLLDLFALHSNLGDPGERFGVLPLMPWQFVTYMFLHDAHNPMHFLFNMLTLVMFGGAVERRLGSRGFLRFYLVCGIAGGVLMLLPWFQSVTIGASGAVLGVLTAFGLMYPEAPVLLLFIPVPAKWVVLFFAILNLGSAAGSMRATGAGGSNVAFMAHVGGMAAAYVMLRGAPLGVRLRRRWDERARLEHRRRSAEHRQHLDEVLDKMHREGKESLTQEEWRSLVEESKRLRGE